MSILTEVCHCECQRAWYEETCHTVRISCSLILLRSSGWEKRFVREVFVNVA